MHRGLLHRLTHMLLCLSVSVATPLPLYTRLSYGCLCPPPRPSLVPLSLLPISKKDEYPHESRCRGRERERKGQQEAISSCSGLLQQQQEGERRTEAAAEAAAAAAAAAAAGRAERKPTWQ